MACECCPIATAVGGIPEVIKDPNVGWLVSPKEHSKFAEAMIDAASRTIAERDEMGKSARQTIVQNFNLSKQYEKLAEIVESLSVTTENSVALDRMPEDGARS